ncbi:MAG: SDR family NAD(P)-dependent oxidoreductase [Burkholderiales bacterium]
MIRFDNRVAIVTGAGTGLGRAYALLLAARGARVVVNDIGGSVDGQGDGSATPAQAVVDEIKAAGGQALANFDSVADPAGAQRMVQSALDTWGRLDILINNAGILREGPLQGMSLDALEKVIGVHLMGTLYCTRAALVPMLKQRYGRIVLTSSASGLMGHADQSVYGAAKSAMLGLMNCVKLDCADTGVLINTVAPSADTRMSKGLIKHELARNMSPHLVAPMMAWFASEQCQETGQTVNACGGYFFKVALYKAAGAQFDPLEPITPEMIDAAWSDRIADLSAPEPYRGTLASLEPNLRRLGRLD